MLRASLDPAWIGSGYGGGGLVVAGKQQDQSAPSKATGYHWLDRWVQWGTQAGYSLRSC